MHIRAHWTLDGASAIVSRPAIIALLTSGAVAVPAPIASIPFSFAGPAAQENPLPDNRPGKLEIPSPTFAGGQAYLLTNVSSGGPKATTKVAWSHPEPGGLAQSTGRPDTQERHSSISRTELPNAPVHEESGQLTVQIDEAKFSEGGLQSPQLESLERTSGSPSPEPQRTALTMPAMELKSMMRRVVSARVGEKEPTAAATVAYSQRSYTDIPLGTTRRDKISPASEIVNIPSSAPVQAAAAPGSETSGTEVSKYRSTARGLEFEVPLSVNGSQAGNVSLLIADSENISVQLGGVLALLEPIMDASEFDRMSASQGANAYVTLNELRAAGLAVSFDKHDRLRLEAS